MEALADPKCTTPGLGNGGLRALYSDWAAGHQDRVTVIDITAALCPRSRCQATLNGVDLRFDKLHFSKPGSILVARLLLAQVPAGSLP
jgi:hypothetical protein